MCEVCCWLPCTLESRNFRWGWRRIAFQGSEIRRCWSYLWIQIVAGGGQRPGDKRQWQRARVGWRSSRQLAPKVFCCSALTWRPSMASRSEEVPIDVQHPKTHPKKIPRFCPKAGFQKILCRKSGMSPQGAGVGWRSSRQLVPKQFCGSALACGTLYHNDGPTTSLCGKKVTIYCSSQNTGLWSDSTNHSRDPLPGTMSCRSTKLCPWAPRPHASPGVQRWSIIPPGGHTRCPPSTLNLVSATVIIFFF